MVNCFFNQGFGQLNHVRPRGSGSKMKIQSPMVVVEGMKLLSLVRVFANEPPR